MSISSSAQPLSRSASIDNIIQFPGIQESGNQEQVENSLPWYGDRQCLIRVIQYLARRRQRMGVSLASVARKAKVRPSLIEVAEARFVVPNSRQFKAWSEALGVSWDEVWNRSL